MVGKGSDDRGGVEKGSIKRFHGKGLLGSRQFEEADRSKVESPPMPRDCSAKEVIELNHHQLRNQGRNNAPKHESSKEVPPPRKVQGFRDREPNINHREHEGSDCRYHEQLLKFHDPKYLEVLHRSNKRLLVLVMLLWLGFVSFVVRFSQARVSSLATGDAHDWTLFSFVVTSLFFFTYILALVFYAGTQWRLAAWLARVIGWATGLVPVIAVGWFAVVAGGVAALKLAVWWVFIGGFFWASFGKFLEWPPVADTPDTNPSNFSKSHPFS